MHETGGGIYIAQNRDGVPFKSAFPKYLNLLVAKIFKFRYLNWISNIILYYYISIPQPAGMNQEYSQKALTDFHQRRKFQFKHLPWRQHYGKVSVFVDILVEFDKYWGDSESGCGIFDGPQLSENWLRIRNKSKQQSGNETSRLL